MDKGAENLSDLMGYRYSPISERGPLRFPDGKNIALIITFNLETWDLIKETDEPYYAGGPQFYPTRFPVGYLISRITVGANMDSASVSGASTSCSMNLAFAQAVRPTL